MSGNRFSLSSEFEFESNISDKKRKLNFTFLE